LKQVGRKAATQEIQSAVIIIKKQNMKETKKAPIQAPNNQAAQVQCIQPIWTRKPDKIELREHDEFYESTTEVKT
jgi:HSP90 family molecular chaperone